jgi:signal transduction histidine kinase/ActR/RegA family two-component response regulator
MRLRLFHSIRVMIPVVVTIAVLPSLFALLYSGLEARNKALQDAEQETLRMVQSMAIIQERITASTQAMLSSLTLVPSVYNLDLEACNELFRKIIELNPIYTNIILADLNGDIIASAVDHPPINLADRKHFKDACKTRKFSTGEYIMSRTTSEPAFPFSYPLLDEKNQVKAVLIAAMGLKQYRELFSEKLLPEGSFFGVTDHAGLRLFRIPIPTAEFDLGKPISPLVWDLVRTGERNGVINQDGSDGIHRIIAFSKLDLGAGTPAYMYMFVGVPEKTLAKNASQVMFKNAIFTSTSWLLAILLSWMIGRDLIIKKVKKLTKAASQFGSGNFNMPTGLDHNEGELGQVAEAFDRMADRLRLADRDRDILQEQLNQAQKLESIGRLAGGVAHDFNNMLMVIIGYTQMLMAEISPEDPNQESLEEIYNAAKKSADLTRQLLAFARKQAISPVLLDLNVTIAGMLKMLQRLIGENIRVVWVPEETLWPIKVDPAQVDQLLANLSVNARDAIDGVGTMTIATANMTIDASYCEDHFECIPGDYVMISVSDDGCGMDKETRSRLFEPFFTTKGLGKGTGLGLATVYGVVKQNKGFISVYSEPGKGSCFKIYFPRHFSKISKEEKERQIEIFKGHGELILLVEDEISILNMGKAMLQQLGYQVIAVPTPSEVLSSISSIAYPIRLLITDVVMPEMSGRELADRIREVYPDVKCLYMSGYTSNVIACQGVLDEGVQFLEKPFTVNALAAKVREILDMKNG